jgi:tRNA pseudouridine55 synthase
MIMPRGATDLSGILLVDKGQGMTSHDVVNAVRRITGEKRVGHAGTLDPAATGLLVVLVGPATRLAPYLTGADKKYYARIVFGRETNTDDAEGKITRTASVPADFAEEDVATVKVADLVGEDIQVPPSFSAIKKDGETAYRAARAGKDVELEARPISIADAQLLGVEPGPPVAWNVSLTVSKGTYIRAIARDLGRDLGTAAHLGLLRRTRSGPLHVDDSHSLQALESADDITALMTPSAPALGLQVIPVDEATAQLVANGRVLNAEGPLAGLSAGDQVALTNDDRLIAVYERDVEAVRPATVIPGGVL